VECERKREIKSPHDQRRVQRGRGMALLIIPSVVWTPRDETRGVVLGIIVLPPPTAATAEFYPRDLLFAILGLN